MSGNFTDLPGFLEKPMAALRDNIAFTPAAETARVLLEECPARAGTLAVAAMLGFLPPEHPALEKMGAEYPESVVRIVTGIHAVLNHEDPHLRGQAQFAEDPDVRACFLAVGVMNLERLTGTFGGHAMSASLVLNLGENRKRAGTVGEAVKIVNDRDGVAVRRLLGTTREKELEKRAALRLEQVERMLGPPPANEDRPSQGKPDKAFARN